MAELLLYGFPYSPYLLLIESGLYLLPYLPYGFDVLFGSYGFALSVPRYFPVLGSTRIGGAANTGALINATIMIKLRI